jgi:hypothetical protein
VEAAGFNLPEKAGVYYRGGLLNKRVVMPGCRGKTPGRWIAVSDSGHAENLNNRMESTS